MGKYLLLTAAVAGVLWWTYSKGYGHGSDSAKVACGEQLQARDAAQREALNAEIRNQQAQRVAAVQQARAYWEAQHKREQVVQTIEKEVIKYVEREKASNDRACELDVDFVRIWNTANRSTADQGSADD